ncbi:hypothetical protein Tdes44962_MAKER08640 [Teratosphaeria destructans]|uniref:Uncharacterized protein n=1 Tax=Teratosphaeria destructans TaxID=418781 RepID=A0A9W7W483_9PEZI|nr:hypothetical protein Tdes44962_MAKER08640 [Teratosphaeria destructans]
MPAMMRAGMASMKTAAMPMRETSRPHAPAKALYSLVAGGEPNTCHFTAAMERPRTQAPKRSWKKRVMRVASMVGPEMESIVGVEAFWRDWGVVGTAW